MEKIKWEDLTESEQNFAVRILHQKTTLKKLKDQTHSQYAGCFTGNWLFEELGVTHEEIQKWGKGFIYVMQEAGLKFSISDDKGNSFFSNWHDEEQKNGKLLRLSFELLGYFSQAEKILKLIKEQKPSDFFTKKLIEGFVSKSFEKDLSDMVRASNALTKVLQRDFSEDPLANLMVDFFSELKKK